MQQKVKAKSKVHFGELLQLS